METQKQNISLKETAEVSCTECGSIAFQQAVLMRKVSALISENGKEGFLPIPTFSCAKCGHVNEAFIPSELRSTILI